MAAIWETTNTQSEASPTCKIANDSDQHRSDKAEGELTRSAANDIEVDFSTAQETSGDDVRVFLWMERKKRREWQNTEQKVQHHGERELQTRVLIGSFDVTNGEMCVSVCVFEQTLHGVNIIDSKTTHIHPQEEELNEQV